MRAAGPPSVAARRFLPTHYAGALQSIYPFVPVANAEPLSYTSVFALIKVEDRQLAPSAELFIRLLQDVHQARTAQRKSLSAWPTATPIGFRRETPSSGKMLKRACVTTGAAFRSKVCARRQAR